MANAPSAASRRSVNVKRWILAALGAVLILTAAVIIVSVVLRPDDIDFSITDASKHHAVDGTNLSLTLAVHNPSKRAGVQYCSVLVYLRYTKATTEESTIPINRITAPECQPRQSTASINVSAFLLAEDYFVAQNGSAPEIGVLVMTVVRFKVLTGYSTWPYNVRVSCLPTNYFNPSLSFPVNCTA